MSVLISGGNLGVGGSWRSTYKNKRDEVLSANWFLYIISKNGKLYEKLKKLKNPNIIPFPYISCKEKMNDLYDQMDAILTKPGGVTVSESLFKRKPILIYDAWPGQEEINLQKLKKAGLIFHLNKKNIHAQICTILQDEVGIN